MRLPPKTLPTRRNAHPRSPVRQGFRVALARVAFPLLVRTPLTPLPSLPSKLSTKRASFALSRHLNLESFETLDQDSVSYGMVHRTESLLGRAQRTDRYQAPINPMLVPHDPLQQLRDLDRTSPQFYPQLIDLLHGDKYRGVVPSLRSDDLTWLIEYLDSVSLQTTPSYFPLNAGIGPSWYFRSCQHSVSGIPISRHHPTRLTSIKNPRANRPQYPSPRRNVDGRKRNISVLIARNCSTGPSASEFTSTHIRAINVRFCCETSLSLFLCDRDSYPALIQPTHVRSPTARGNST